MNKLAQKCPLCDIEVDENKRYPKYVCNECLDSGIFTKEGKKIKYFNIGLYGGIKNEVDGKITNEVIYKCYVKEVECYTVEGRFGGIVIQKAAD